MKEEKYRVECICRHCGTFLMGTAEKPHFTREELSKSWIGLVSSAPLNAPKCPNKNCGYSTDVDYNAGVSFMIDDGNKKVTSEEFFKSE